MRARIFKRAKYVATVTPGREIVIEGQRLPASHPWRDLVKTGDIGHPGLRELGYSCQALVPAARPEPTAEQIAARRRTAIDAERDTRIAAGFTFGGVRFQLDSESQDKVTAMGAAAKFAVLGGAQAGNLRWADPDRDFSWIATDNSQVEMDAPTMSAFADAAMQWVYAHTLAARALKDADPIPEDFANDEHWP